MNTNTAILILGAGDFSGALRVTMENSEYDAAKAHKNGTEADPMHSASRSLKPGISIIATEYRTEAASDALFKAIDAKLRKDNPKLKSEYLFHDMWASNKNSILNIGGKVIEGFDATRYPLTMGKFDRIIFENPHTGSYGSNAFDDYTLAAATSNEEFLKGIMRQARDHLTTRGYLEIGICGWPYVSKPSRHEKWAQGMGLEDPDKAKAFAENVRLVYVDTHDLGERKVARNDGTYFKADMLYLRFQLPQ